MFCRFIYSKFKTEINLDCLIIQDFDLLVTTLFTLTTDDLHETLHNCFS